MEAADLEGIPGNTHFGFDTTMSEVWRSCIQDAGDKPERQHSLCSKAKPSPRTGGNTSLAHGKGFFGGEVDDALGFGPATVALNSLEVAFFTIHEPIFSP